jgi:hypothetical protein
MHWHSRTPEHSGGENGAGHARFDASLGPRRCTSARAIRCDQDLGCYRFRARFLLFFAGTEGVASVRMQTRICELRWRHRNSLETLWKLERPLKPLSGETPLANPTSSSAPSGWTEKIPMAPATQFKV